MRKAVSNIIIILAKLIFIIFAFSIVFKKVTLVGLEDTLDEVSPLTLIGAFILSNISLFFSSLRSRYYFSTMGLHFSKKFALAIYYLGSLFNIILPGGVSGDGYKVYILWKTVKFSKMKSIRIMLYERVNGLNVLIIMGLIIFLFSSFAKLIPHAYPLSALLLLITWPVYLLGCKYILHDKIETALHAGVYSFWVQFFQISMAVVLINGIMPDAKLVDYMNLTVLFVIASILAILPISIGGVGIRELTFLYGFSYFGYDSEVKFGVSLALLIFVINILTALPGVVIFFYRKKLEIN